MFVSTGTTKQINTSKYILLPNKHKHTKKLSTFNAKKEKNIKIHTGLVLTPSSVVAVSSRGSIECEYETLLVQNNTARETLITATGGTLLMILFFKM